MKKPCIAIDVSKGESHVEACLGLNNVFVKAKKIKHDVVGFNYILDVVKQIEDKMGEKPVVLFEATGVYHKALEFFVAEQKLEYFVINPLHSAKFRKRELRSVKTDKRDCSNLARMYYNGLLKESYKEEEIYNQLRQLNRYYETQVSHLVKCKVNFNEKLDIVFPGYKQLFSVLYSDISLLIIKKYNHPKNIVGKDVNTITKFLESKTSHRRDYCVNFAEKLINFSKICCPGCDKESGDVDILLGLVNELEYYKDLCEKTLNRIINFSKNIPYFNILHSIPGIGENLAARLIAEIGDITRFENNKQLIAYAGIDPIIYQSGQISGEHLKMSKKGNKRLRRLLYLAITCMLRNKSDNNSIREFYQKKMQQTSGMKSMVASFACANKFLRTIYSMCINGTLYQ
jgi:transposase